MQYQLHTETPLLWLLIIPKHSVKQLIQLYIKKKNVASIMQAYLSCPQRWSSTPSNMREEDPITQDNYSGRCQLNSLTGTEEINSDTCYLCQIFPFWDSCSLKCLHQLLTLATMQTNVSCSLWNAIGFRYHVMLPLNPVSNGSYLLGRCQLLTKVTAFGGRQAASNCLWIGTQSLSYSRWTLCDSHDSTEGTWGLSCAADE